METALNIELKKDMQKITNIMGRLVAEGIEKGMNYKDAKENAFNVFKKHPDGEQVVMMWMASLLIK